MVYAWNLWIINIKMTRRAADTKKSTELQKALHQVGLVYVGPNGALIIPDLTYTETDKVNATARACKFRVTPPNEKAMHEAATVLAGANGALPVVGFTYNGTPQTLPSLV